MEEKSLLQIVGEYSHEGYRIEIMNHPPYDQLEIIMRYPKEATVDFIQVSCMIDHEDLGVFGSIYKTRMINLFADMKRKIMQKQHERQTPSDN